jgi:hypothetical protein
MDNIVMTGGFRGTVDFGGPVPLVAASTDIFVAKYTRTGAYLWAKSFSAMGSTGYESAHGLSAGVSQTGDIALTGQFCGAISFGGATMSSANNCFTGAADLFATQLKGSGAQINSVRAGGSGSPGVTGRIESAADGRLYLVGYFGGYAEFGGREFTANGWDAFIVAMAPL